MREAPETPREAWARFSRRYTWEDGRRCIKVHFLRPLDPVYRGADVRMDDPIAADCYVFDFERMGWHHADGHDTEWVQVTCDGEIIDAIDVRDPA